MIYMRTKEFVNELSRKMGAYKKDVEELMLCHFRDVLLDAVSKNEKVRLAGIGYFYPALANKPTKNGKRRIILKFKPSTSFIQDLNSEKPS